MLLAQASPSMHARLIAPRPFLALNFGFSLPLSLLACGD
jgi:hypothetical protein